jgi:hypothetical protein
MNAFIRYACCALLAIIPAQAQLTGAADRDYAVKTLDPIARRSLSHSPRES